MNTGVAIRNRKGELRPKLRFSDAEEILAVRRRLGLNQSDFWKTVGVTQSGGSRYESGRKVPMPTQLLLQIAYGTPGESSRMLQWLRD